MILPKMLALAARDCNREDHSSKKGQIRLQGGLKQYVIDFRFAPNAKATSWIDRSLRPIE
jgi:hypothetical protein